MTTAAAAIEQIDTLRIELEAYAAKHRGAARVECELAFALYEIVAAWYAEPLPEDRP